MARDCLAVVWSTIDLLNLALFGCRVISGVAQVPIEQHQRIARRAHRAVNLRLVAMCVGAGIIGGSEVNSSGRIAIKRSAQRARLATSARAS